MRADVGRNQNGGVGREEKEVLFQVPVLLNTLLLTSFNTISSETKRHHPEWTNDVDLFFPNRASLSAKESGNCKRTSQHPISTGATGARPGQSGAVASTLDPVLSAIECSSATRLSGEFRRDAWLMIDHPRFQYPKRTKSGSSPRCNSLPRRPSNRTFWHFIYGSRDHDCSQRRMRIFSERFAADGSGPRHVSLYAVAARFQVRICGLVLNRYRSHFCVIRVLALQLSVWSTA